MVLPNQVHLKLYYYYYQVAMAVTPSASGYFFFPSFLDMRWMTFEQASKGNTSTSLSHPKRVCVGHLFF